MINFAVWYVLKHHTTFLELFDFSLLPDALPPRKRSWGLNGNTIAAQLEEIVSATLGNIGSQSDGTLTIKRNPSYEDGTFRAALDDVITWGTSDLRSNPEITQGFFNQTAYIRLYILSMQTTNETEAFASIAPGTQQGQAVGSNQYESVLLPPGSGQDECNNLAGHIYAKENTPVSDISLSLVRNFDVLDPALMVWHTISIPAEDTPLNKALFYRMTPLSVSRNWTQTDARTWVKEIDAVFEIETFGQPGVKLPINAGDALNFPAFPEFEIPFGSLPPSTPTGEDNGTVDSEDGLETSAFLNGFAAIVTSTYDLITTASFNNLVPSWKKTSNLTHSVNWVEWDYNSAFFTSGDRSAAVGILFVATDAAGDNLFIYRMPDIRDEEVYTLLETIDITGDAGALRNGRIKQDASDPDLILVTWKTENGTYFSRSTDEGQTWTAKAGVDDLSQDVTGNSVPHGIDILNGRQVTTAYSSTEGYSVYYADGAGAWNRVDATALNPAQQAPLATIKFKDTVNTLYVSNHERSVDDVPYVITNGNDLPTPNTFTVEFLSGTGSDTDPQSFVLWSSEFDFRTEGDAIMAARITLDPPADFAIENLLTLNAYTSYNVDGGGGGFTANANVSCQVTAYDSSDVELVTFAYETDLFIPWYDIIERNRKRGNYSVPAAVSARYIIIEWTWVYAGGAAYDKLAVTPSTLWAYSSEESFGGATSGEFFALSAMDTVPVWTDILPPNSETFTVTGDFGVSTVPSAVAGVTNTDGNLYISDDSGASWSLRQSGSTKRQITRKGDVIVTGGTNEVWISSNKGINFFSKKGNILSAAGGSIGKTAQLLVI